MSLVAPLQTACLVAFALLLVLAAWQDLRTMRIADAVSLAVVPVFAVWALSGVVLGTVSFAMIGLALACAAGVFGLGAIAFAIGVLGGGDVKLLAASSLFAGTALMPDFLMVTSLAGGVLGLAVLAGAPLGPVAPAGHATIRLRLRGGLPYGPAIAAGGLWVAGSLALQ
jgi:prepilin peptidase CpaA